MAKRTLWLTATPDEVFLSVRSVYEKSPWQVSDLNTSTRQIAGKTGMSLFSWVMIVEARVWSSKGGSVLEVEANPVLLGHDLMGQRDEVVDSVVDQVASSYRV